LARDAQALLLALLLHRKNACCWLTMVSDKHAIFEWSCSTAGEPARLALGKTAKANSKPGFTGKTARLALFYRLVKQSQTCWLAKQSQTSCFTWNSKPGFTVLPQN
jgi:hypothetical protein